MERRAAPSADAPLLGLQLYTLREQCARDFGAVLRRVSSMGYVGVELFGLHDTPIDEVARTLDDTGLRVASGLLALEPDDQFQSTLDLYASLGAETVVVVALPPESFASSDALDRVADRLNAAHVKAQDRSLTLGYHNHWWEIEARNDDRPALVALFERLDPQVVAEVDIYWPRVAGMDPADLVRMLGSRVTMLHVKDGPVDPAVPMVAVGDGALDVPRVLEAATSARWHVVELDDYAGDMFDAVDASARFLLDGGWSRGQENAL